MEEGREDVTTLREVPKQDATTPIEIMPKQIDEELMPPPATKASPTQVTKENVTKLNTIIVHSKDEGLSSPEGLLQSERLFHYDRYPIRGSSSAFLTSLTSASDLSSPLTSAYASTDSLQNVRESRKEEDEEGDFGSAKGDDSMVEMALPLKTNKSGIMSSLPIDRSTLRATDISSPKIQPYNRLHTNHDRILEDFEINPLSRTHTPSQSTSSTPGDYATNHQTLGRELYSSGKHDEEYEQSHSKTPLLYPSDYQAPRETDQATRDRSSQGNKVLNQYETLDKLGSGAHGIVKLGRDMVTNRLVAIKSVRKYPKKPRLGKQETPEDKVKKEVAVLKKAQHPHVVTLLEVIDDRNLNKVYLILEYVEKGEIKWRKKTDRDIANFEMTRMKREIAGCTDAASETEHLLKFNDYLHQKHMEQIRNRSAPSSVEGCHDEDNFRDRFINRIQSRQSSRPSSRPTSRTPSDLDISSTHTLRVPSRASQREIIGTDHDLPASTHGSYAEEEEDESMNHATAFQRERWLSDEPTIEQQWTPEEEEYRFVPCLTLSEARDVFRDTVLGLEYLHYHGIIHRDIKPANLLWTKDYRVKISDFGVSYLGRPLEDEDNEVTQKSGEDVSIELAKTVGTPAFYAPELCDPDLFDPDKSITRPQISGQIDVWALGITLYAMIYGRLPFFDQNEFSMYEKIARKEVLIPSKRLRGIDYEAVVLTNSNKREEHVLMYEDVDDELQDLIRRLLIKDPTKRITIKEVKHHPWVLRGVDDPSTWIQVTDPSYKGARIEISQADLHKAVVPVSLFGKVWKELTNIARGRVQSRNKIHGNRVSASLSRSNTLNKDQRRASLKGDELSFLNLLRGGSARDVTDPSLLRSIVTTPTSERGEDSYPHSLPMENILRPSARTVTTNDSIVTVKGQDFEPQRKLPGHDSVGSSSSSLAKILDGTRVATRRITGRVRSRDSQGSRSDDMNLVSRASSSGDHVEFTKPGSPVDSLNLDSTRSSPLVSPITSGGITSADSFQSFEKGRVARKRASTTSWGHLSPGLDEIYRDKSSNSNQFPPLANAIPWSQKQQPLGEGFVSIPVHAATSDSGASLLTTGETITPARMKQKQEEREEYRNWRSQQQKHHQDRFHQDDNSPPPRQGTSVDAVKSYDGDEEEEEEGSDDEGIVIGGKN